MTAKLVTVVTLNDDNTKKIETVCMGLRNIINAMGAVANLLKMLMVASTMADEDLDVTINPKEVEQLDPNQPEKASEALEKEKKSDEEAEEFDESEIFPEEEEGGGEEPLDISLNFAGIEKEQ